MPFSKSFTITDNPHSPGGNKFITWSIAFSILFFAVIHFSNSWTYLNDVQKVGNSLDDARLTNAIVASENFSEVKNWIKFGKNLTGPAYVFNKYLGFESKGRRVVSFLVVLGSFIYLLLVLARYRVLSAIGILIFAFLFTVAEEVVVYSSTGLVGYPAQLLCSAVLVHLLLAFNQRDPDLKERLWIIGIFVVMTLISMRMIVGIYAVVLALAFVGILGYRSSTGHLAKHFMVFLSLLILPTLIALYSLIDPPIELLNPYRGINMYFFESRYPKTISGAALFSSDYSLILFKSGIKPHPYLLNSAHLSWVNPALIVLFLLGVLGSFFNRRLLTLVLFLAAGALGHIILSMATLVPYGNIRYFLPFLVMFPILVAAGVDAVVRGILALMPTRSKPVENTLSAVTAVLVAGILFYFASSTIQANHRIDNIVADGYATTLNEQVSNEAGVVADVWTIDVLKSELKGLDFDKTYILKTHFKTHRKKKMPRNLDNVVCWEEYLKTNKRLIVVTSMPFTQEFYGELFERASEQFHISDRPSHRTRNFALLMVKD